MQELIGARVSLILVDIWIRCACVTLSIHPVFRYCMLLGPAESLTLHDNHISGKFIAEDNLVEMRM